MAGEIVTADRARELLRRQIKAHGDQSGWCRAHDISTASVNEFLRGKRDIAPASICRALDIIAPTRPDAVMLAKLRAAKARLDARKHAAGAEP